MTSLGYLVVLIEMQLIVLVDTKQHDISTDTNHAVLSNTEPFY